MQEDMSTDVSLFARGTNEHSSCISAPGTVFTDVAGYSALRIYNDYMSRTGVFTPCVAPVALWPFPGRAITHG